MALQKKRTFATSDVLVNAPLVWPVERYGWRNLLEVTMSPAGPTFGVRVEPVLVAESRETLLRAYRPLEEEPLLFEAFTNAPESADSVLNFANRYGLLGITKNFARPGAEVTLANIEKGERLGDWLEQIRAVKNVIGVWECLRGSSSEQELKKYIEWRGQTVFFIEPPLLLDDGTCVKGGGVTIASRETGVRAHLLRQWKKGERISPAKAFIALEVNRNLRGNVSPQLLLDHSRELLPYMKAFNLVGAIWYQIYDAYSGGAKMRRCSICHGWIASFERKTKTKHTHCAGRLRQQRFQERRRQQERLAHPQTKSRKQ